MFGHLGVHVLGKRSVQNADCILQTGFKMQTTHKMQTEFNAKLRCRLTRKTVFFVVRNVVTFDFIKFSFSGNPLAYGTAEANEMIAS